MFKKLLLTKRFWGILMGAVGKGVFLINPVIGTILMAGGTGLASAGFVDAAKRKSDENEEKKLNPDG